MTDMRRITSASIREELSSGRIQVAVVGLGYVGLPMALTLATKGVHVIGVDKRASINQGLLRGELPIYEPGLEELLSALDRENLRLSGLSEAVSDADIIVVTVGTPAASNGKPILKDLISVSESIGRRLKPGKAVIIRSTVPPGTTQRVLLPRLQKPRNLTCGEDFAVAYCPERLVEGRALTELENVPHIIGAADDLGFRVAEGFFSLIGGEVIRARTIATAEMAKIVDNVYRDVNIALANELALICEASGTDVLDVIRVANAGPRTRVLMPGCGVGGSCLTKDPLMLIYFAKKHGLRARVLTATQARNRYMPTHTMKLVRSAFHEMHKRITGSRIVVMGLAFKGETDDIRSSIAIPIVEDLSRSGARVIGYDPHVSSENIKNAFGKLPITRDPFEAAKESDCIVVTADHKEILSLDLKQLAKVAKRPSALIDGRNVFDKADAMKAGFVFKGVGRTNTY